MNNYLIRKMNIDEFDKCSNIWDFEKQKNIKGQVYQELNKGDRETFIYEMGNSFIAEISVVYKKEDKDYCIPNQRVYISRLIVKPEFRNQGIGSKLVDYIIEYCKNKGYTEMSIGVDIDNVAARHLYEKKGFNKIIFEGADSQGEYVKLLKQI